MFGFRYLAPTWSRMTSTPFLPVLAAVHSLTVSEKSGVVVKSMVRSTPSSFTLASLSGWVVTIRRLLGVSALASWMAAVLTPPPPP